MSHEPKPAPLSVEEIEEWRVGISTPSPYHDKATMYFTDWAKFSLRALALIDSLREELARERGDLI